MKDLFSVTQMSESEIRSAIDRYTSEMDDLSYWAVFSDTDAGKKFVTKLDERIKLLRGLYISISPSDPNFSAKIARIQGAEEEACTAVSRIKNSREEKKRLDKIINSCLNELQIRAGSRLRSGRDSSQKGITNA